MLFHKTPPAAPSVLSTVLPHFVSETELLQLRREAAHLLPDHEELRLDPDSYGDVACTGTHTVRWPFGCDHLDAFVTSPQLAKLAAAASGTDVTLRRMYLRALYAGIAQSSGPTCTADSGAVIYLVIELTDGTLHIRQARDVPRFLAPAQSAVHMSLVLEFTREWMPTA